MANARVVESAVEVLTIDSPHALVSESVIEVVTISTASPVIGSLVGLRVILRGVKRMRNTPDETAETVELKESAHVDRAV
jgi:hypothetical protein